MKDIDKYLKEQLYQDLCFIYNINETGGLYPGQIKLAAFITNEIIDKGNEKHFELNYTKNDFNFDIIFFDNISINVNLWDRTNVRAKAEFYGNLESDDPYIKYNYNKENGNLINLLITVSCPEDTKYYQDYIKGRISHELNHSYTYWEIIKDDFEAFEKQNVKIPDNYHNKLHKWSDEIYSKISSHIENPTNTEAKQICYNLIYTLTRYERNAFLSEIVSYFFDNNGLFKKIENVNNELDKSKQYKLYTDEGTKIIDIIKNEWSDEYKQELASAYNEIYNSDRSYNKVIKILEFKLKETIKKLNENINILCKRYKDGYDIEENLSYLHLPYKIKWF